MIIYNFMQFNTNTNYCKYKVLSPVLATVCKCPL